MAWSPEQYVLFEAERTRPVRDLLHAVPERAVRQAVDLGCGPGNSTEVLAARFPEAEIIGLDSSEAMIAASRRRLPRLRFEVMGIEDWDPPGPFDLILANAVLQWVPDHAALFPRLAGKLAPGGVLAAQMPDNFDEPTHRLMRSVASSGPWAERLGGVSRYPRQTPRWYFEMLAGCAARVDVWRTVYHHRLAGGVDGVVAWVKGSGLRPFLAGLDESEQESFIDLYKAGLAEAYPVLADGAVLLPFPRLFMIATR